MDNTLTLNNGAANVAFALKTVDDGKALWVSPSPQGDFDGALRHSRSAAKSKTGILTRTSTTIVPQYNSATGKYEGFIQVRTITSAASTVQTSEVLKAVLMNNAAFNTAANPAYRDEYTQGSDALT